MEMIFGMESARIHLQPAVSGAKEAQEVNGAEEEARDKDESLRPVRDEYIPEEKQEATGRYWMDTDEDGKLKVYFDDPDKSEPESKTGAPARDGADKKAEICRGSTDKVDREIERLKKEKERLKQQISSEKDETKLKKLEEKLAQVERELSQKDNDTYRRQHSVFS